MPGVLLWGWDNTNKKWIPLAVDANGYVKVDLSKIKLNHLADVYVPSPTDGHVLYWDNATSLWKAKASYTSPTTTAGDIIKRGAAADERLAIGSASQVLTVVAGAPAWSAAPGGTKIQDADGDTSWDTEESADEDKIHGKVKGIEAFLLDDAGVLTFAKQSAARAYLSAVQSIPTTSWTLAELDTENYDIQSEFDTTAHKFTVKKAGIYLIVGSMHWHSSQVVADKLFGVSIYKNAAYLSGTYLHSAVATHLETSCNEMINLSVDDELELKIYQATGASKNVSATYTFMSICKLA